jgi:GPH family glycoside/pentoside/hexuronide:cation symporter
MRAIEAQATVAGHVKVGYGFGELGIAATEFFVRVYLLKLYVDVVGLGASVAGLILAATVLWDAVTDPVMGELSDRTRMGWGRRRPWIAVGAVSSAVMVVVLFSPPAIDTQLAKAIYLLVTYVALNIALTLFAVPHAALGGELTSDPVGRNEVFGWRFLFANLGLVLGIVIPAAVAGDLAEGSRWLAGVVVVSGLLTTVATRGMDRPDSGRRRITLAALEQSLRAVFSSAPFRPLVAAYIVGSAALTLNSALALFYYEHRLRLTESEVFVWVLLPFALVIAISIGGWVLLARRFGKRLTAFAGVMLLGIGTTAVYPLLPPGQLLGPVIWGVIGGVLVGSVFLLDATVADVVDFDEAVSGVHREGMYFGVWRMGSKVARAAGLALTGLLLESIGFVGGAAVQTETASLGLAILFGPVVGLLFIIAAVVWLCVPLDASVQERVRTIVSWRRSRLEGSSRADGRPNHFEDRAQ